MLAGGLDLLYRQALTRPHRPYSRVEVWKNGSQVAELAPLQQDLRQGELVFSGGSVAATLTSRVSRTLSMTVREQLYPNDADDLLSPFGTELRAYRGIEFGDGDRTYVWPVFRGKVQQPTMQEDGTCQVTANDPAQDVIDNGFIRPENSTVGANVEDEWRRLIVDGLPAALFGQSDRFSEKMPAVAWEDDRGRALDEIATSVGALWYPLASGRFVLRRYAWTVAAEPLLTYSDGDGGTVLTAGFGRNRQEVRNRVGVVAERSDGSQPVFAIAEDNDPTSPTYVGGSFGVRTTVIKLNTPTSQAAAQGVANAYLRRLLAASESWKTSMVADAALELGDCIAYDARGRTGVVQVVDSIQLPLTLVDSMAVQSRSQVIPLLGSQEAT